MMTTDICRKIRLYNSTVLCDIFRSRLKVNSLMILFKKGNNKYVRLWHCLEPLYGSTWSKNIEDRVTYYRYCKGFG